MQRSSTFVDCSTVSPNDTWKKSWYWLPQYSRNSSEKKFQSYSSFIVVFPGGSGGRQTSCENEPDCVVSPRPVDTRAMRAPSVGVVMPSSPMMRPSPFTVKPATLARKPLCTSKLRFTIGPVARLIASSPPSVNVDGGTWPSCWPGVNACESGWPSSSFEKSDTPI